MVTLLVITGFGARYIKKAFFPNFTYNQVYVEYSLPQGYSTGALKRDMSSIQSELLKKDYIKNVTYSLGATPSRYNLVRTMGEMATGYGEFIIDFTDYDNLLKYKDSIAVFMRDNYPDADSRVKQYNLILSTSHLVEVMFTGPDPQVLRTLAKKAEAVISQSDKVRNLINDWQPPGKRFVVDYSQEMAKRAGVSRLDISSSILAATDGIPVTSYFEDDRTYPVLLKTANADESKIDELVNIPVWGMLSFNLPVSELIKQEAKPDEVKERILSATPLSKLINGVSVSWEEQLIRRYNGERAITVKCDPVEGYSASKVRSELVDEIESIELPEGYEMSWRGEFYSQQKAMKYIIMFLPVGIILMVILLIALFKDYKKPLIILFSIPFASIGIIAGMVLTQKDFGFVAIVGALGLIGMMIKNGVVLIEQIEMEIKDGKNGYIAIVSSAVSRLRPVIMASFTTILGMIPLLGDAMFGGMAVTIMGGLFVGTLITLVFISVLYALFFGIKKES